MACRAEDERPGHRPPPDPRRGPAAVRRDGKPWSKAPSGRSCATLHTGRIVLGRTRNTGTGSRPGERKDRDTPRQEWTWAAEENAHPAFVTFEVWEAAQHIGAERGSVRDYSTPGPGHRDYPLRARLLFASSATPYGLSKSYPRKKGGANT